MGVCPLWMVAGVGSILSRLPLFATSPHHFTPGEMSCSEPPFASAPAQTPANADAAWVGSPFSATLPLYSGFGRPAGVFGLGAGAPSLALQPIERYPP